MSRHTCACTSALHTCACTCDTAYLCMYLCSAHLCMHLCHRTPVRAPVQCTPVHAPEMCGPSCSLFSGFKHLVSRPVLGWSLIFRLSSAQPILLLKFQVRLTSPQQDFRYRFPKSRVLDLIIMEQTNIIPSTLEIRRRKKNNI